MRLFFSLALVGLFFSFSAQEIINYPYNPDSDGDAFVASVDMLETLAVFGSTFTPNEIVVNGIGLAEVLGQLIDNQNLLQATVDAQQAYISELQQYISIEPETVLISGANLQVVSGEGSTNSVVNGTGNIIIGYDEDSANVKTGSHNLVVGYGHTYSSYGGIVVGYNNRIIGIYSSVSGGQVNTAEGDFSSVSGGFLNRAEGSKSSVSGGFCNRALGEESSISGGGENIAFGLRSSVSGGGGNFTQGFESSISGGFFNYTEGVRSSVSGGQFNIAVGSHSSVSGDAWNTFLDNSVDGNTID